MRFTKILFAALMALAAMQAAADVTDQETFTFEVNDDANFSIDNVNGNIEIVAVEGNTIEVVANKKADNQKAMDRIEILVSATSSSVEIETELNKKGERWFNWGDGDGASVSYVVHVPPTVSLNSVDTVNGDVEVEGVTAEVSVDTVNGSIKVKGMASNADLDTVNGRIEAHFVSFDGRQRAVCDTVNGSINVYLPDNASAEVTAESLNGSIKGGDFGLETNKGRFVGRDINGTIGGGDARLNLDTVNGAIKIAKN